MVKNRNKRIKKPFNDYELIRQIRDEIIEGVPTDEAEISDVKLRKLLENRYKAGELSEKTYNIVESEELISEKVTSDQEEIKLPSKK